MDNKRKKKLIWQLPLLTILIVGTVLIIRQQNNTPYQKDSGFIFGTVYNITYQYDHSLKEDIETELRRVDAEFSMFNEQSTVSRINRNENPSLSPMFLDVWRMATKINADTDGAFDVTVAPLVNAWGFGFKNEQMPERAQVDSLRSFVSMSLLDLVNGDRRLMKKDPRVMLDFSAIAKGYGSDVIANLLRRHDIQNFMVEIGGEVVTHGVSPKRVPWRIGVTKPTEDSLQTDGPLQTVLNVTDCAMATSGNYRNFYYKDGHKYAHTIDPRTGYPVQHNILSATVLSPASCAQADAYATSFMVLGLEGAQEVLERNPKLMAYLIYTDEQGQLAIWYSPSLKSKLP